MKKEIGEKIKMLRKKAGYTQAELARRLGISSSAVGMYEQGRREPDNDTVVKLCGILHTTTDNLLGNVIQNSEQEGMEISEVFDEFTEKLSRQPGLMFDGIPLNDEDRRKIIDAIRVAAAIAGQQYKRSAGNA